MRASKARALLRFRLLFHRSFHDRLLVTGVGMTGGRHIAEDFTSDRAFIDGRFLSHIPATLAFQIVKGKSVLSNMIIRFPGGDQMDKGGKRIPFETIFSCSRQASQKSRSGAGTGAEGLHFPKQICVNLLHFPDRAGAVRSVAGRAEPCDGPIRSSSSSNLGPLQSDIRKSSQLLAAAKEFRQYEAVDQSWEARYEA